MATCFVCKHILEQLIPKNFPLQTHIFQGKQYKNSYTLNIIKLDNKKTKIKIKIHVKLKANQAVLLNREESNENVENYLRVNLFNKISESL